MGGRGVCAGEITASCDEVRTRGAGPVGLLFRSRPVGSGSRRPELPRGGPLCREQSRRGGRRSTAAVPIDVLHLSLPDSLWWSLRGPERVFVGDAGSKMAFTGGRSPRLSASRLNWPSTGDFRSPRHVFGRCPSRCRSRPLLALVDESAAGGRGWWGAAVVLSRCLVGPFALSALPGRSGRLLGPRVAPFPLDVLFRRAG